MANLILSTIGAQAARLRFKLVESDDGLGLTRKQMNSKHRSKKYAVTLVAIQLLLGIFTIVAAAPFRVQFTTQPTGSTIGASLGNVVVQLVDKGGTNVAQSGTTITVSLNKSGAFTGATNLTTDPAGKATFPGLKVNLPGNNFSLTARSTGLKSATSTAFNVGKGSVVATLAASATKLAYGQKITFTVSIRANTRRPTCRPAALFSKMAS